MLLLTPFVNLPQETLKDPFLQPLAFVHLGDHGPDRRHLLLFKLLVQLLDLQLGEDGLAPRFLVRVLPAVVLVQDAALHGGGALEGLVDDPRALVVLDVRADFAQGLGRREDVEVVVLGLEVLAEGNEDVLRLPEVGRGGEPEVVQGEGDREVEAVVGGLVDDDEAELVEGEVGQVDPILRGGDEVALLADLRLEAGFVEELEEVEVGRVRPEVLL